MADGGLPRSSINPSTDIASVVASVSEGGGGSLTESREIDLSNRLLRTYYSSLEPTEKEEIRKNPKRLYLLGGKMKRRISKERTKRLYKAGILYKKP